MMYFEFDGPAPNFNTMKSFEKQPQIFYTFGYSALDKSEVCKQSFTPSLHFDLAFSLTILCCDQKIELMVSFTYRMHHFHRP